MASIKLKNVCKIYCDNLTVIKNLSLDINDGDFAVLVGPSGCGKSTTLRMIAGLEEITDGDLFIDGELSNYIPPKDRDIAMVFQNYALYPHMTVFDNMAFGLKLRKLPRSEIKKRVEDAATLLDISHLLDRKPKCLSGGQRQRVALGRAIVRKPKVFLLDEPLSNLDANLRNQMRTEISKLHKKLHSTFIYVTHDQTEAMTMGTKIVVMKDGKIQQVGSPQKIYNYPCNTFVAQFIGSPPMKFIDATVLKKDGEFVLKFLDYEIKVPNCEEKNKYLEMFIEKPVLIGIRPENIFYERDKISSKNIGEFNGTVEMTELVGSDTYLYLSVGNNSITSKANILTPYKSGDVINIYVDASKIHIFDKNTGEAVLNLN